MPQISMHATSRARGGWSTMIWLVGAAAVKAARLVVHAAMQDGETRVLRYPVLNFSTSTATRVRVRRSTKFSLDMARATSTKLVPTGLQPYTVPEGT